MHFNCQKDRGNAGRRGGWYQPLPPRVRILQGSAQTPNAQRRRCFHDVFSHFILMMLILTNYRRPLEPTNTIFLESPCLFGMMESFKGTPASAIFSSSR